MMVLRLITFCVLITAISWFIIGFLQPSSSFCGGVTPVIDKSPLVKSGQKGKPTHVAQMGIRFYRNFISPVIGARCGMEPSCSSFSYKAYAQYGFVVGTLMTVDRLLHERDEYTVSPVVCSKKDIEGNCMELLTYDPPESNVFWWKTEGRFGGAK